MAKQKTTYGIGQYRFTNSADYVEVLGVNEDGITYTAPPGSTAGDMDASYRDIKVPLAHGTGGTKVKFETNRDYHLFIQIPRDIGFDHTVKIYLGQTTQEANNIIQPIRKIYVPAAPAMDGTSSPLHYVAIYAQDNGNVPGDTVYGPVEISESDIIKQDGVATKITVQGQETKYFNYSILNESWRVQPSDNQYVTADIIFRPLLDNFDCLYIVLDRTSDDYRIINPDGSIGHKININNGFICQLHILKPIMGSPSGTCFPPIVYNTLTRIGVWSRPGLMMAINGEEISVGQSGYYELDAIPITSISIFAQDFARDNFSIDYQYVDTQSS